MTVNDAVVVGIDPGINCTGYAILSYSNNITRIISFGSIKPPKKLKKYSDKLHYICSSLKAAIDDFNLDSFYLSFEVPFLGRNVKSYSVLSMVRGAVLVFFHDKIKECLEFSPTQVKSYIGFSGNSSKHFVLVSLQSFFPGLEASCLDESDAIAIALSCVLYLR